MLILTIIFGVRNAKAQTNAFPIGPYTTDTEIIFDFTPLNQWGTFWIWPPAGTQERNSGYPVMKMGFGGEFVYINSTNAPGGKPSINPLGTVWDGNHTYNMKITLHYSSTPHSVSVEAKESTSSTWISLFENEMQYFDSTIHSFGIIPAGEINDDIIAGNTVINIDASSISGTVLSVHSYELELELNVFPNPTENKIQITAPLDIEEIKIYTITGRLLKSISSPNSREASIDVSSFNSGVYFLQIETEKGYGIKRFVKN